MGIRSKFKGKNTKKCILKAVLKKNATVVVKLCPKNYLFCIPTIFLPQLFYIFTQIYLPYLWHFATLATLSLSREVVSSKTLTICRLLGLLLPPTVSSQLPAQVSSSTCRHTDRNRLDWRQPQNILESSKESTRLYLLVLEEGGKILRLRALFCHSGTPLEIWTASI